MITPYTESKHNHENHDGETRKIAKIVDVESDTQNRNMHHDMVNFNPFQLS